MQKNENGFSAWLILILIIVVAVVGSAGWLVRNSQNVEDARQSVSTEPEVSNNDANKSETDIGTEDNTIVAKKGVFMGVAPKTGSGSISLARNADGSYAVRLEDDFKVQNGPALYVSFANNGQVDHNTLFAELKAFDGKQEYYVPSNIDVSRYGQVMIYCKEFSVVFSIADLH